ncbi:MAG TPA: c-type cytochrome domain-containing protein, partial [Gemmataceae bacterium]|nr:c-type cytochrome domain-containing protein [Gemmataceae bacterium]
MRVLVFVVLPSVVVALTAPVRAQPPAAGPAGLEFFEKRVRPVLVEHCHQCHSTSAKKLRGGLLLDSRAGLLKGGDNGPAIVIGSPEKSRLLEAISYKNVDLQMPPKERLPGPVITDLAAWVKAGAVWPEERNAAATSKEAFDLQGRKKNHWAWQPLHVSPPPVVRDRTWARTPVDAFLLARLDAKGIRPAEPA